MTVTSSARETVWICTFYKTIYYLEVVSIDFVDLQPAQKNARSLVLLSLALFLMLANNHLNKQKLRFFGEKNLHKESNIDCQIEAWFAFVYLYTVYL